MPYRKGIGSRIRQLRKDNPSMSNAEIARIVDTAPRHVYKVIGTSPPKKLRACTACEVLLKTSKAYPGSPFRDTHAYRTGLCLSCRDDPKFQPSKVLKLLFICKICKITFPREVWRVKQIEARGYQVSYCSIKCRKIFFAGPHKRGGRKRQIVCRRKQGEIVCKVA